LNTTRPVLIVGGGLSGLAAAVELAAAGTPVVVLEQKPSLGGRAYSFREANTGEVVDNGQHVLIAAYERTLRFLATVGTLHLLSIQASLRMTFHHPDRGFHTFRMAALPPPLNLLSGVLRTSLFSVADRLRFLRVGRSLYAPDVLERVHSWTISEWLESTGQSQEARRSFWEPLAVSVMNDHIDTASAETFVRTLRAAFLGHHRNAALAIPKVGLSELFVNGARDFVLARGGAVRCNTDVVAIKTSGDIAQGVVLRDGHELDCAALILAVPPHRAAGLLVPVLSGHVFPDFGSSPIVSIHLWLGTDPMAHEVTGLIGRRVQWLFNRRKLLTGPGDGGHLSAVISAADGYVEMTNEELTRIAVDDIRSAYPGTSADPLHAVVIRERRATHRPRPDIEPLRPDQRTAIPNLALAGDWTATGYPGTIEGAVISGERSAGIIKEWLRARRGS
jgi:squalene-associated FAD-dependent desaturase